MRKLPLYPSGLPRAPASAVEPEQRDPSCERCVLHENVRHVCMAPEGRPGGILVLGEKPSRLEDTAGKVFYGQHGLQFRRMLEKWWHGPVQYDYAIRCGTGAKKIKDKQIAACRVYTASALEEAPQRILCLGSDPAYSVLGRRISAYVVRKAYGWAQGPNGEPIPVYVLPAPAIAFRNRFATRAFEEDLQWAVSSTHTPWFQEAYTVLVETEAHARAAAKALRKHQWYTYDVETSGLMHDRDFRIETVTLLGDTASKSYTWTREALQDEGARAILAALFRDPRLAAVAQNGKYDDRSVMLDLDAEIPNVLYDTRLGRKLLDPEADARLATLAETVGMGGHKHGAKASLDAIKKELNRQANPLPEFTPKGKRRKIAPPKFNVPTDVLRKIREGHETESFAYKFMDPRTLYRYNALDVWSTRDVAKDQMPRLISHPTISRAWSLVVKDANRAVRQIEHWGFPVDRAAVVNLATYCDQRISETQAQMRQYTDINPASPRQLAKFLFEELGLRSVKETASGAQSTDEDALETLRGEHPYVNHLLEYRKLAKFSGTYAHGLLRHIREDGRVHPSVLLDGAGTGRVSMRDPNCFDAETEVLTPTGWVRFDALDPRYLPRVAQYLESGEIQFVQPQGYIRKKAPALVHIDNEHITLRVTPDHRCLLRDRKCGGLRVVPARDYLRDAQQINAGMYLGGNQSVDPEFVRLLVATQADGSWHDSGIDFSFHKSRKARRLIAILEELGTPYSYRFSLHTKRHRFRVTASLAVQEIMRLLTDAKIWGWWLLDWDRAALDVFVEEIWRWDGCVTRRNHYASAVRQNVDVVQAILALSGERARWRLYVPESERCRVSWQVDTTRRDYSLTANVSQKIVPHGKDVFCVSVPSSFIVVRRGQNVMVTGNCQNIPRAKGSVLGKMARDCFTASSPNHVLIEADFSQLELRVAAMLAQDDVMIADFKNGIDIHSNGATLCCEAAWRIPCAKWDTMSKDDRDPYRSQIKTVIFGRLYGKTDKGIAREFNVSVGTIVQINKLIWGRYKKLERFMQQCVTEARRTGEAWTWWASGRSRVRPIWRILDQDQAMRAHYERTAGNTSVQGTAADFTTASLSPIVDWIIGDAVPAELVCTVHDSILLNVHKSAAHEARYQIKRIMLSHDSGGVPLGVDIKWGPSWGSLTDFPEQG